MKLALGIALLSSPWIGGAIAVYGLVPTLIGIGIVAACVGLTAGGLSALNA